MQCTYCEQPALLPHNIYPPLCQTHHEMIILISRCRRLNLPVTARNVVKLLRQINGRVTLRPREVPGLLAAMEARDAALNR